MKNFMLFKGVSADSGDIFGDGSCKAFYKLDGDVKDERGSYNGVATNVNYSTGKFGQCGVFGGNAKIEVASLATASAISFWFKANNVTSIIGVLSVGGKEIGIYNNKLLIAYGNVGYAKSTIVVGTLYHVVFNLTDNSIFVNGVLATEATNLGGWAVSVGSFLIGRRQYSSQFYNGSIDHVRVFNRALTQAEVTQLFNE